MSNTEGSDVDELRREHGEAFEKRSVDVSPMPMEQRLGRVIRQKRQEMTLTLSDLAKVAQVSVAMLSRLETGQTSASLDALIRIGGALGIELSEMFRLAESRSGAAHQMKAADQPEVVRTGTRHGHAYRLLSWQLGPRRVFESFMIDMKDDSSAYARFQHPGQEFIYMITGRMRYRSGDQVFLMEPGDSLTFLAEIIHGVEEMLDRHVQFLSVLIETQ